MLCDVIGVRCLFFIPCGMRALGMLAGVATPERWGSLPAGSGVKMLVMIVGTLYVHSHAISYLPHGLIASKMSLTDLNSASGFSNKITGLTLLLID